jgi:hypothetical protein
MLFNTLNVKRNLKDCLLFEAPVCAEMKFKVSLFYSIDIYCIIAVFVPLEINWSKLTLWLSLVL